MNKLPLMAIPLQRILIIGLLLIGSKLASLMMPALWAAPDETTPTGGQLAGSNGVSTPEEFESDKEQFEEDATPATGLGPVFNGTSCAQCHHQPLSGGSSDVVELRTQAGLVHQRALNGFPVERVPTSDTPTSRRLSPTLFGLGYVESIGDAALRAVVSSQPAAMRGTLIDVPVLEAPGKTRVGRFGWKDQEATLLSFAADAEFNKKGVGNRLLPPNGPNEDPENDIDLYTRFMRSLNVPTPDAAAFQTAEVKAGAGVFRSIGCIVCHVEFHTTLPAGTVINGGAFTVPKALGGVTISPYSDFALHDVGTGDGVGVVGFRTAPLWGLRFRNRFMHDSGSVTFDAAIRRHNGQAKDVIDKYRGIGGDQQLQLIQFLRSL